MKGLMRVFSGGPAMWRMENDWTAKKGYIGECAGNHLVGSPQKRWNDTPKD